MNKLMQKTKNRSEKIILVTCIDARQKYLEGLGDCSIFEAVVDITELITRRTQYGFRPSFEDRLKDVIFADTLAALRDVLIGRAPHRVILFSPPPDLERLSPIVSLIEAHNVRRDFAINKNSAQSLIPFPRARWHARGLNSFLRGGQRLGIDHLYYSDKIFLPPWADKVVARELIKVRHVDGPRSDRWNGGYGVFLDSYLPFHNEFIAAFGRICPEEFYKRLRVLMLRLAEQVVANRVIIALHPNSKKEEVAYLDGFEWHIGKTNELIAGAEQVWSFGSDATGTAVCYEKPAAYINFPDLLPVGMQNYIYQKGRTLGISTIDFDGDGLKKHEASVFGRVLNRSRYRRSFGEGAPLLSDVCTERSLGSC